MRICTEVCATFSQASIVVEGNRAHCKPSSHTVRIIRTVDRRGFCLHDRRPTLTPPGMQ